MNTPLAGVVAHRDNSGYRVAVPEERALPYAGLLDPLFAERTEAEWWCRRRAGILHQKQLRPSGVNAAMVRATVAAVRAELPNWADRVPLRVSRDVVRFWGQETVSRWVAESGGRFAGWIPGDTTPEVDYRARRVDNEWDLWLHREGVDPVGWAVVTQPSACHVEFFAADLPVGTAAGWRLEAGRPARSELVTI